MTNTTPEQVHDLLHRIPAEGLSAIKDLFCTELSYRRADLPLSWRSWPDRAKQRLTEPPTLLARHESQFGDFDVLYAKMSPEPPGRNSPLSLTAERLVINQLLQDHPYALFIFSNTEENHWHFVNVRYDQDLSRRRVFRRISVGPDEQLRTASERVAMLDVRELKPGLLGLHPLKLQQRHDDAFDVEKVTSAFFQQYQQVFNAFQNDLYNQGHDHEWAHDYALQFLNRLMFLYYVQRKRWLGRDTDFLCHFWNAYKRANHPENTFVQHWLNVLFFEAFNNRFQADRPHPQQFPDSIHHALATAPFLNGGLFQRNDLDCAHSPHIADSRFEEIFDFFEGYNFTITEDTPLDQEVAVDPEMIGKVYESLVNVSEEADERGEAGIFYTPRVEIDLMCRLSLVDWLTNHLGDQNKNLIYEAVFAFDPDDKEHADAALANHDLWPQLDELLRGVTVVDPACGSGSFLVGMLYVLNDVLARADTQLGRQQTPYDRKKRIIANSLYGVDVMEWAVNVAELRLWLQLAIDSELRPPELQSRPLLPNLSFKLRSGDSVVQEIGGINLALRRGSRLIAPPLKARINSLQAEKRRFYNNDPHCKYPSEDHLRRAELKLFRDILDGRIKAISDRLKEVEDALRPQENLFGEVQSTQIDLDRLSLERDRDRLNAYREQATRAREALRTVQDVPVVWDIAFVEVLEGDRHGFDIVIGNPPYVRQESIHDPKTPAQQVTAASKKLYKRKLAESVYAAWPRTFGFDPATRRPKWNLDARSDLYIYFYLHGLSLLNDHGTFCFITSNSWLDAGYGKDLQEFLLTRGQVKLILDNEVRRSFATADINTVIVLLGAPRDTNTRRPASLKHTARFVMLAVPFEKVLSPVIWEEIEEATDPKTLPEYRVFPIEQRRMLANGINSDENTFAGGKWGGKYLRAPNIYWQVLKKAADKLVQLGDVAHVKFGIKTGANAFFHLDRHAIAEWGIEERYLAPLMKSPRECMRMVIEPRQWRYSLFMCHEHRRDLEGTAALEYIKWGESRGFNERATCRSRRRWWDLGKWEPPPIISPASFHELYRAFLNKPAVLMDKRLYGVYVDPALAQSLIVCLNSTLTTLMLEVGSRTGLGEGLIDLTVYETAMCPILRPSLLHPVRLPTRPILSLPQELRKADRRSLDDAVFAALELTSGERDAVYEAVLELTSTRVEKADSA